MLLIKPSFKVEDEIDGNKILYDLERFGRTCYKSEDKMTRDSAEKFIKMVVERGHETILEHEKVSVRIICDRGVTHEIVRHRLASYSQESTRYCNYKGGVTFILPCWFDKDNTLCQVGERDHAINTPVTSEEFWVNHMFRCEQMYKNLLDEGWTPQQARSVLPNALKTEIIMTANLREWSHFFKMRASKYAHPQMQEIARPLLKEFQTLIPIIYDGINEDE